MSEVFRHGRSVIAELADTPLWARTDTETTDHLLGCVNLLSQLTAVCALGVRQIDARGIPKQAGASSVTGWLMRHGHLNAGSAGRLVALAAQLDARPVLQAQTLGGGVSVDQARIIADAVTGLTATVAEIPAADPRVVDRCEAALIAHATGADEADGSHLRPGGHDPQHLARIAERILTHVAPQIAEQAERLRLERADKRAGQARSLTIRAVGEGLSRVTAVMGVEDLATLTTAITPLCRLKAFPDERRDERTLPQRRLDALIDVCRRTIAGGTLPSHGGVKPQLNLTCSAESLMTRLGPAARLDSGEAVSWTTVRRLACDALVLPAVMNSAGTVLDVGHRVRLFTGGLRRAVILRDGGCVFPGCDRPPDYCDVHHLQHHADGGPTSLSNGGLLCTHHHRVMHGDTGWEMFIDPADGLPTFIPPPHIDPLRRPIRNQLHRLRQ